jgi:hypothetical protein
MVANIRRGMGVGGLTRKKLGELSGVRVIVRI